MWGGLLAGLGLSVQTWSAGIGLTDSPRKDDVKLVAPGSVADLFVDGGEFKVVRIATECLAADVERVTGKRPLIKDDEKKLSSQAVIVGTIGKSALVDKLIRAGRLDASAVAGKWESFVVATVSQPLPGVDAALVIAGSDRRGTAFGVFTLSEAMGVSPWYWWADVPPVRRTTIAVRAGTFIQGPPSVKYRGIFINDEDWGLQPWSAETFEPEVGDIGPKTYAKVCELLLRLKANYLWPAMHECTRAFNSIPENKLVADDYAIVMGSSHAEPMLYNNASEWKLPKEQWNYQTHPDVVRSVWEKRLQENGRFENTYTLGIRGIHDRPMQGGKTTAERVKLVERVIADQRDLIARYVNPKVESVPQIFVPYKEVLPIYQAGLQVPDDVTLVWVDDNHGYIRQLSTPEEQKRSGGSGIYYHLSYWGAPEDYLWLGTTPPALTWAEMHKAYENGARTLWVVNVGDIKMIEITMEFFLRMAWDIAPWDANAQTAFLQQWAERDFGKAHAAEIAAIMDEFYRINFGAKPEHLRLTKFSANYGEVEQRLERFAKLVKQTDSLYARLSPEKRNAFYELVVYPVRGAALANELNLSPEAEEAQRAFDQLQAETEFFNEQIAGGKWRRIISSNPRNRPALQKPDLAKRAATNVMAEADTTSIAIEAEKPSRATAATGTAWKVIAGLGRSGDSIALLPTTASVSGEAALEYEFTASKAGAAKVVIYCIPALPLNSQHKLRYTVAMDGEPPKEFDLATKEFDRTWSANVIRGAAIGMTDHNFAAAGKHKLALRPLDPGLVFDKVVIDFGDMKPSHLGPPVTSGK